MSGASLRALGLPSARDEAWKYAARTLSRRDWWATPTDALSLPEKAAIDAAVLPVAGPVLVFAGGHAVPRALGGFGTLPAGVTLRPLPEDAVKAPNGDSGEHRVAAIAATTTPGAWELSIAANIDAGSLQLLHLPAQGAGALVLRIRLARGATLQLLESLADGASPALTTGSEIATALGTAANTPPPTLTRWLQVQLADGRQFRLGGDSVLRLGSRGLKLEQGQIIAWVNPGQQGGSPLRIHTRMATASIVGTTVFIEATDTGLKIFSWEGQVECLTNQGQRETLSSGQQLAFENGVWRKTRLTQPEAAIRRQKSILLNGFATPMETLPVIEKELGLSALPVLR